MAIIHSEYCSSIEKGYSGYPNLLTNWSSDSDFIATASNKQSSGAVTAVSTTNISETDVQSSLD